MAIKLSVSVRSPIKYLRYACPSLYWTKLNRTSFDKPIVTYKALNSKRHGYQVISLCKITHQVSTICMSISLWIYNQSHIFWQTYRTYKALNSNRNSHHVIILFKITHQVLQYAYPIIYGSNLNHTNFDEPIASMRL